jgi:hypothetical protein
MSCQDCEDFQNLNQTSYYRWKNANIEIRACKTHLLEIFDVLNDAQEESSLSLCSFCMCMTKTIDGECGKCGNKKIKL